MLQNYIATLFVLLTGEALAQQCFSSSGCTGARVAAPGPSAIECCVGTEVGRSYGSPGDCTIHQCIVHGFERLSYTTPESDALQDINFRPNVTGTGQPGNIGIIIGTIDLEEDTAKLSDISYFRPVSVPQDTNEALNIEVIPQYDTVSLELDDRIIMRFTPDNPAITPEVYFAETGEFLRDSTFVYVIDDDNLTISFLSLDTNVGEHEGPVAIRLMISEAQIPFTLTLTPTTVDYALADTRITVTDCLTEAYSRLPTAGKASPGRDFDATIVNKQILPSSTNRQVSHNIVIYDDNLNALYWWQSWDQKYQMSLPVSGSCLVNKCVMGD